MLDALQKKELLKMPISQHYIGFCNNIKINVIFQKNSRIFSVVFPALDSFTSSLFTLTSYLPPIILHRTDRRFI